MNSIRQSVRPKHQVLILKCYPRFQKAAAEIKPNPSELSYLLYYASTKRSKLQKVGDFLEKKTLHDVRRGRHGNVQVTLQILASLIEKCPRDLPLFSFPILRVLQAVVDTGEISLIEESVNTFAAFCSHYDSTKLAADQHHVRQYTHLIKSYASLASKSARVGKPRDVSVPVAIRLRTAGLKSINALVTAESFSDESSRHLELVIPSILENLYSDQPGQLNHLQHKDHEFQQTEKEQAMKRRMSMVASRATESVEADPSTVIGTTADLDSRLDEEVSILALQCLRHIFSADNRGQMRLATTAVLAFVRARTELSKKIKVNSRVSALTDWPTELFHIMCRWTPVHERFIILVTLMDTLIRSPIVESDLDNQLLLTRMLSSLLKSDINFIGLSVIDVLNGIVQHILLLLQLGGQESELSPHPQQDTAVVENNTSARSSPIANFNQHIVMELVEKPSIPRVELLDLLQKCIGDLATHVYYNDQIGDMVSSILLRLKPSSGGLVAAVSALENPAQAADAIASTESLKEKPFTDGYFSFVTARILALQAVKNIIVTANSRSAADTGAVGRNHVGLSAWNGTQWLLRDVDGRVRKAYVDALLTWLQLEASRKWLRLAEPAPPTRSRSKRGENEGNGAVKREKSLAMALQGKLNTKVRSSFLQLLHLAIYENAVQYAESEADILLLHLLNMALIRTMGVNSVRVSLPMIFRLQEDILSFEHVSAKIAIGSLVHGFFRGLIEVFELGHTFIGRHIHEEISRRMRRGAWMQSIQVPPMPLEKIQAPGSETRPVGLTDAALQNESLRPFDARIDLVDNITDAYSEQVMSPSSSPPGSPSRMKSSGSVSLANMPMTPGIAIERALPNKVREEMLSSWSREICLSAAEKASTKAASYTGSKSGSGRHDSPNGLFGLPEFTTTNGFGSARKDFLSPEAGPNRSNSHDSLAKGSHGKASNHSQVLRVDDLKRALAGHRAPLQALNDPNHRESSLTNADDTASESMATASFVASEASGPHGDLREEPAIVEEPGTAVTADFAVPSDSPEAKRLSQSSDRKITTPTQEKSTLPGYSTLDEDIPPVPQLPANFSTPEFRTPMGSPMPTRTDKRLGEAVDVQPSTFSLGRSSSSKLREQAARPSSSKGANSWAAARTADGKIDVQALLKNINSNVGSVKRPTSSMGAPPY